MAVLNLKHVDWWTACVVMVTTIITMVATRSCDQFKKDSQKLLKCETVKQNECYFDTDRCDGFSECQDNTDELGCHVTDCPWPGCIPAESDVTNCTLREEGKSEGCKTNNCTEQPFTGIVYCVSTQRCFNITHSPQDCMCDPPCGENETCCRDGSACYSSAQECDGIQQCQNADDEALCVDTNKERRLAINRLVFSSLNFLFIIVPIVLAFIICFCCWRRRKLPRWRAMKAEKEQAALNAENHLISHPPGGHPAGPYPAGSYPSGAYLAQGTPQPPTSFPAQFTPTHRSSAGTPIGYHSPIHSAAGTPIHDGRYTPMNRSSTGTPLHEVGYYTPSNRGSLAGTPLNETATFVVPPAGPGGAATYNPASLIAGNTTEHAHTGSQSDLSIAGAAERSSKKGKNKQKKKVKEKNKPKNKKTQ